MPKGKRADNPLRTRPLVNPESGAHVRITPIDSRRAEEFFEPDADLVKLASSRDEVEFSRTRSSAEGERSVEALEQRVHELEQELLSARESLRQKDLELHSIRSMRAPAYPVSDSLRALPEQAPAISLPLAASPLSLPPEALSLAAPPAPSAESFSFDGPPSSSTWQPASPPSAGYPVLQHVSVALRASTMPPGPDSVPPSQRKAPRRACELELEFTEETHFFTGLTQDISEGGVFIATYQLFPIGSRLELAFELPDGTKISCWGRVRWLREETANCRPGMGVAFGELSESALRAISRFCAERPPIYMEW
ncbi:MAG: PilZ domain-containing protein [Myxococcota bacterium]